MAPKKAVAEQKILLGKPKGTLKMGLVGLPNVGKSTTFNLLCKQSVPAENFPFCTIDPHEARMNVPDERFLKLCDHFNPKSRLPATLSIFDIAGLVPNAHQGQGLGNAFLANIQAVDGIFHVVRAFESEEVIHTEGEVNPRNDLQTISDELRYKDLDRTRRLLEEAESKMKREKSKDKSKQQELEVLQKVIDSLDSGKWVSAVNWAASEVEWINTFCLLTAKPVVYLVNLSEGDFVRQKNKHLPAIHRWVTESLPGPIIPYSADFELKLSQLEGDGAKEDYIKSVGAKQSMLDKIINTGYSALNLLHYFTCGEDEVKCWTIREGTKAPQAAGIIHTDFERGFICAEVYTYPDLMEHGSETAVKAAGKYHQKGKEYVVLDGDIIFFKFNVSSSSKKK